MSAGYRNPYGFPKEKVTKRYLRAGSKVLNTAEEGMIEFKISKLGGIMLEPGFRKKSKRFWNTEF